MARTTNKQPKQKAAKSMEAALWESCNKLRGAVEPAEYKHVVLSLIFLKYAGDRFNLRKQELIDMGLQEYVDQVDFYTAENVFYLPEECRWSYIMENAKQANIFQIIDDALSNIEKKNKQLAGALPNNYYSNLGLDKTKFASLLDEINKLDTIKDAENDLIGRVYEYFLGKFAIAEGKGKGEYYTPKSVVNLIAELIEPYDGKIYDPCCGSGGMFVQSAKFLQNHQKSLSGISIYGQEFNTSTWKMAHMNVAIRGLEANLGQSAADTFMDDQHPQLKADFIMANPPFNLKDWGADKLQNDKRWAFGIPPSSNANFAWMQHMIHHLSPVGRIGLVLANGALSSQTGGEGIIRQKIVEADLVEGIIALPSQLFYSTGIPVSLWFLSKEKKQSGKVVFIDARDMGEMVTRAVRELKPEEITKLAETFNAYREGTLEDEAGFCSVKTLDEIAEQDYILTPGRYVGIAEREEDGESFNEKMERLTSELSDLFNESHRLEYEVKKQLSSIGFDI